MRTRKDVRKLDKRELQSLNDGFEAMVAVDGKGGYQHLAGLYGKPGPCYRPDEALFLPWHRAFLLVFEQSLDRFFPGTSLAYWNWSDESTAVKGVPGRLRSVAYTDKDQGVWLNALYRSPVDCLGPENFTNRTPGDVEILRQLAHAAGEAQSLDGFAPFSTALREISRKLRAWIGGHSDEDDLAAYDPIFWFAHANVDRMWSAWRRAHPEAALPESLLGVELKPFAVTVRDVLELDRSHYSYED
jgi:hypothetical protein